MAVVAVHEIWSGRRGSKNDKGVRTYSRVFRVICDTLNDDIRAIRRAAGIPRIGSTFPSDTAATCRSVEPSQTDEPLVWEVHCEYSTERTEAQQNESTDGGPDGGEDGGENEDPTQRPIKVRWSTEQGTKPAESADFYPLINSAGEPFDPVPEVERDNLRLIVTRNESSFDPATALLFVNSINFQPWQLQGTTFAAAVARCAHISGELIFEGAISFWQVDYEFVFAPLNDFQTPFYLKDSPFAARVRYDPVAGDVPPEKGWNIWLLDEGHYTRVGDVSANLDAPARLNQVLDESGTPTGPVPLNGSGRRAPASEAPTFIKFRVYRNMDFNLFRF